MDNNEHGTNLAEVGTDLISRQQAIDAAQEWFDGLIVGSFDGLKKKLEAVPSAQPEPLTDKEQRIFLAAMSREEKVCKQVDEECRDCREPYEDSLVWVCHEIMRKVKKKGKKGTMGDLIDRQAAIDALHMHLMYRMGTDSNKKRLDDWINGLPSAQPRGKWIYHIDDLFPAESTKECDQCHAEQPLICDDEFCPHCGAKMEVNHESN